MAKVYSKNESPLVPLPTNAFIPQRDLDKSPVLEAKHLGIDFGGLTAVDDFNLTIGRTEIAGLIGPNGAGKTTVFNLLTKVYQPTRGTVLVDGMDTHGMTTAQVNRLGVARTFQNINLLADEKNAQQFSACIIGWGGENHPRFVGEFGRCQILAHLGIRSVYDIIKIPPIPNVSDRLSLIIRDIALQIRKVEHTQLVGLHNAPQCRTHGCAGKRFTICQHIGSCP